MTQRRSLLLSLVCLLIFFVAPELAIEASAQTPQLVLITAEGHSTNVTAAQIEKVPHVTVTTLDHDKPVHFDGVPLSALL